MNKINLSDTLKSLIPASMLGRLAMYLAFLRGGVFLLKVLLASINKAGAARALDGWATALTLAVSAVLAMLLIRWVRTRLLWSLRNRLIVTYMFIGVIPVVLVLAMVGIAGYLVGTQYAISQARLELDSEIHGLETMNASVSAQIAEQISVAPLAFEKKLLPPEVRYLQKRFPGLVVKAFFDGKLIASSRLAARSWLTSSRTESQSQLRAKAVLQRSWPFRATVQPLAIPQSLW